MEYILRINNLNTNYFTDFNLNIEPNKYYSIIGRTNSGKTILCKTISAILPTTNLITLDNIILNRKNVNKYIKKLGYVKEYNSKVFIKSKVFNELSYPLLNLGYSKVYIVRRIKSLLNKLNCLDLIDKNIKDLSLSEKQKILFIESLLHKPKLLLIDNAFSLLNEKDYKTINNYLIEQIYNKKLTVMLFTSNLNYTINTDYTYLIDNFKIREFNKTINVLQNDKLLNQYGLEVPFNIDLSLKLMSYDLIDKVYFKQEKMVKDIWK